MKQCHALHTRNSPHNSTYWLPTLDILPCQKAHRHAHLQYQGPSSRGRRGGGWQSLLTSALSSRLAPMRGVSGSSGTANEYRVRKLTKSIPLRSLYKYTTRTPATLFFLLGPLISDSGSCPRVSGSKLSIHPVWKSEEQHRLVPDARGPGLHLRLGFRVA